MRNFLKTVKHVSFKELKKIVKSQDMDYAGICDPGQPSKEAQELYKRSMEAEFNPMERRLIRYELNIEGLSDPE